jgi:hypothetical protein
MRLALFEFCILHHPQPRKDAQGNEVRPNSEIICDVQRVLAKDEAQASILAARKIPEANMENLQDIEIRVRPF